MADLFVTDGDVTEVIGLPTDAEILAETEDDNAPMNAAQDVDDDDTPVYWAMHAATRSYAETKAMVSFEES